MPHEHCNLYFKQTITQWDEALPLGNGHIGALVWRPSNALRFSLDRGNIWDKTPSREIHNPLFTYDTLVNLAKAGDVEQIRKIFTTPYNRLLPTKLSAGKIIFDFGLQNNVQSNLNLATAEAQLKIGEVVIKSYLHAETKMGYIQVNRPLSEFSYKIDHPCYGGPGSQQEDLEINCLQTCPLSTLHYPLPQIHDHRHCKWFVQEVGKGLQYGVFVKAREDKQTTEFVFAVATSNDGPSWKEDTLSKVEKALQIGYENSFQSHCAWWENYWGKSAITLPDLDFEKTGIWPIICSPLVLAKENIPCHYRACGLRITVYCLLGKGIIITTLTHR